MEQRLATGQGFPMDEVLEHVAKVRAGEIFVSPSARQNPPLPPGVCAAH
jgi:hypothetical protein